MLYRRTHARAMHVTHAITKQSKVRNLDLSSTTNGPIYLAHKLTYCCRMGDLPADARDPRAGPRGQVIRERQVVNKRRALYSGGSHVSAPRT